MATSLPKPPSLTDAPDPNEPDPNALLNGNAVGKGYGVENTAASGGDVAPGGGFAAPQTAGLISGSMAGDTTQPTAPAAATASSMSSYTPTLGTVAPNETMGGQVNDLLKTDNPIMQTARTQAAQAANSRGLLNSSMAVQSGEQAAINSALPIAAQDASVFHDTAARNMAAQNEAGQFNATAQNQSKLLEQQGQNEQTLQKLRGDQATAVATIEANFKTLMQANASASSTFNSVMENIGKIMDDPNTTAEQKQAAVDNQTRMLNAALTVMGGIANVDLTSMLDFSSLRNVLPAPGSPGGPVAPAPGPSAPGTPPPPGSQAAVNQSGHNVGEVFWDSSSGHMMRVEPDGSLTDLGQRD